MAAFATLQVPRPRRPSLQRYHTDHSFQAQTPASQLRRNQEAQHGVGLQNLYIGVAVVEHELGELEVGFASHDGTYSVDFAAYSLTRGSSGTSTPRSGYNTPRSGYSTPRLPATLPEYEDRPTAFANWLIERISTYQSEHLYKFIGAGLTKKVVELSPQLPSRLWLELDIVPVVLKESNGKPHADKNRSVALTVDESADKMARKCVTLFGPGHQPRLFVEYRGHVAVDVDGRAQITSLQDYPKTVGERTWQATLKYAESLKKNNVRIAFFNSTPQGGGVALMRHALIRFFRLLDLKVDWYVPRPKPAVFRITKNNHNILQGVAEADLRTTSDQFSTLDQWCLENASRDWTSDGGALLSPSQDGAHVVIVDDPQMPSLVKIAKEIDPNRPVIFRSHIQVRADLADQEGTPTSEVWNWVWNNVKQADVFISHPVREFVPKNVDFEKVGYMPATTDWLDGLNKNMSKRDNRYYLHEFDTECFKAGMRTLSESRKYIVQIARFDPAKGIPDVLASYAEFRRNYMKDVPIDIVPQLVIAGHGAIDDPDATRIYEETITSIEEKYSDIKSDIVVMRLGPTDQILNALMSEAHVALQLSTREGFEVKVSEAVHKGKPIIATKAGGIPLQVEHGKSGFLVEPGDYKTVAKHLHTLFTDAGAYGRMSDYAKKHVSDEVSTIGNALCWLFLADKLSQIYIGKDKEDSGLEKIKPNSAWINDMAREAADLPYEEGESRLPRMAKLDLSAPVNQ
ncbi:glycosyltransferase family 4 protein [Lojkania enalia]|uniref:Glycosyltransferase family 4 protein n=1 Tax=Lojkania enalia TaxID=147567 RepID=A0A9P4KA82_9PLEO|nr:glycosyltransferase family 4 protein [Didymosphaeria enalia]